MTSRAYWPFAMILLAACVAPAADGEPLDLRVEAVEIAAPEDGPLIFAGAISLRSQDPRFGGLSGLSLDPDGEGFVSVSDAGYWAAGRLSRENGRLTGAEITRYERIRGADGGALSRIRRDAEAVKRHPDGGYLVSFERDHRVAHFADIGAPEGAAIRLKSWRGLQMNAGIEAMLVSDTGEVYAIKEGRLPDGPGSPIWALGQPDRPPVKLPLRGPIYVTGADFGPDGRLYTIERSFRIVQGFNIRIRRYPELPRTTEAAARPEELLRLTGADGMDNMEGIAVWRDAEGKTRVTLISDDNFNALQRTLVVEFILRE